MSATDFMFWVLQFAGFVAQSISIVVLLIIVHFWRKKKKLQQGKIAVGLVSKKSIQRVRNKSTVNYCVHYLFNSDKQKSIDLITGYIHQNEHYWNLAIPISLYKIILSYYGRNLVSDNNYIYSRYNIPIKQWRNINQGESISILYDPNDPRRYNMPSINFEYLKKMNRPFCAGNCKQIAARICGYMVASILAISVVGLYSVSWMVIYFSLESINTLAKRCGFMILSSIIHLIIFIVGYLLLRRHYWSSSKPADHDSLVEQHYNLLV